MTITSPAPLIVHHKAALDGSTPPNSLAGVEACLGAGAAFIEVDITALAGEDYLLVHDDDLSHETTGTGSVAATRPGDVRDLRLRKRDGTATEHPPALLSEVVRTMVALPGRTRLQLDFKNVIPFADDEPLDRLISLIAPRAALFLTGDRDGGSPVEGIRTIESAVRTVYRLHEASERFESVVYPGVGHAYTEDMWERMLSWMTRHLNP